MKKFCYLLLLLCMPLFAAAQQGVLKGLLSDEMGPLPGIEVRVNGGVYRAVSELDGSFSIVGIPYGSYPIRIEAVGFIAYNSNVEIQAPVVELDKIVLGERRLNEVVVRGKTRPSEAKATNMMKTALTQMNIVSAEGVAKLPDRNVAEAVQRLPGVVMETDQGEGRFISFRGTPSDWSSALVNGDRMPVADEESRSRAMNFDIFPSTLIDYIAVAKTLSPNMEGDAIGGSANFMTRNPPVKKLLQASFGYGYNFQAQKPLYNGILAVGNRSKNGKTGFLIGGSIYERNWATDNYQVFFGSNIDHSLTRLELRDYEGKRTTTGLNAAWDYKFSEGASIYAKGIYGSILDDEYNRKTMYNWSTGYGQSIKLQNIHNKLSTRFRGAEIGGVLKSSARTSINWRAATYDNQFRYGNVPYPDKNDPRNGYFVTEFEKPVQFTDFLYLDENGNPTDERNAYSRAKLLRTDSPVPGYGDDHRNIQPTYTNIVPVSPTDTQFAFTRAFSETNRTRERDPLVAQIDLQHKVNSRLVLKAGAKVRLKEGERSVGLALWERNKNNPDPLVYDTYAPQVANDRGGFLKETGAPYSGKMFPFLSGDVLDNFVQDRGDTLVYRAFGVQTPYFQQFTGSSYKYRENVYAAYGMAEWNVTDRLVIVPGIRAEYTMPNVTADSIITVDPALGTVALAAVSAGTNYPALLPMVNARYQANAKTNLRLAITRSFRRPNFNEIKPGAATIDYSNNDLVYGNPNLRPTFSWNFDAGWEYYMGAQSMIAAAVFYKNVKDHIYTAFESSSQDNSGISNEFQIPGGVIAKKFQNAPTAYAAGVELSFNSKFTWLPGQLKNIGLSANYSYTHARMKIEAREAAQALPRQSPNVANLALFFENGTVTARVGMNYRDPYLYELNLYAVKDPASDAMIVAHQDNEYDTYIGKSLTVDASLSWKFRKQFSAFAEANNLTNTPYLRYRGRIERPVKTEYYSIRGLVGIRFEL